MIEMQVPVPDISVNDVLKNRAVKSFDSYDCHKDASHCVGPNEAGNHTGLYLSV